MAGISKEPVEEPPDITTNKLLTDIVYKELAIINGKINRMTKSQLINKLKRYKLDINGSDDVLRRRLKNNYRTIKLSNIGEYVSKNLLPYYVVVDFEATCEEVNPANYHHEIIEFPAVLVNSQTQTIESVFQKYCKPTKNPILSSFCSELTGITQAQVDQADTFEQVIKDFESWLESHELGTKYKYAIVTDGPWDMSRFLYSQCIVSNVPFPKWGKKYVNIRKTFSNFYKCQRICLKDMLEHLKIGFEGRPHCGLDDSKNIANILIRIICDGATVQINERIFLTPKHSPVDIGGEIGTETPELGWGKWHKKSIGKPLEAKFRPIEGTDGTFTVDDVKKARNLKELETAHELSRNEMKLEKLQDNGDDTKLEETKNEESSDEEEEEEEHSWKVVQRKAKHGKKKKKSKKLCH